MSRELLIFLIILGIYTLLLLVICFFNYKFWKYIKEQEIQVEFKGDKDNGNSV